jgi:hypothetical protein
MTKPARCKPALKKKISDCFTGVRWSVKYSDARAGFSREISLEFSSRRNPR